MTDILMNSLALALLLAGFAALVRFTRGDAFGGPGTGHRSDEVRDALQIRRTPDRPDAAGTDRPQRTRIRLVELA